MCGYCGGELDGNSLTLAVTVSPGPRGESSWSVTETRVERWHLCTACQRKPETRVLMRIVNDPWMQAVPPQPKRCEIHCLNPAPAGWNVLKRDRLAPSTCPHCFGDADLIAMPGVMVRRRTLRMRVTGKVFARLPAPRRELSAGETTAPDTEEGDE